MFFITAMTDVEDYFLEEWKGKTVEEIGAIQSKYSSRTFDYYSSLEVAKQAVKENRCDLHECLYTYIVIEEISEGIHAISESEHWYKFNLDEQKWEAIEKPKCTEHVVNHAIG